MENTHLDNLRLKQIALLLASQAIRTSLADTTQTEKIVFLSSAGFSNQEVANLVGATSATVAVRLSESKKKRKAKK